MSRVDEIRARLDAATPGPWTAVRERNAWEEPYTSVRVCPASTREDARFMVEAPADIAWLLDEVERLQHVGRDAIRNGAVYGGEQYGAGLDAGYTIGWRLGAWVAAWVTATVALVTALLVVNL